MRTYRINSGTVDTIQWTGDNLSEVIAFTGKCRDFDKYFPTWEEYEKTVAEKGLKIFTRYDDFIVPPGDFIIANAGELFICNFVFFLLISTVVGQYTVCLERQNTTLIQQIRQAQMSAGEQAVLHNLEQMLEED